MSGIDTEQPRDISEQTGSPDGESFFEAPIDFAAEHLDESWYPISGYEGSGAQVNYIIGVGYEAFSTPREQEQYRAVSRSSKLILGEELDRLDRTMAIYTGSYSHDGNFLIGWESCRLSAKSQKRIGIARHRGFAPGDLYDFFLHVPYLTDGGDPRFLKDTLEVSLAEKGNLAIIGPTDISGAEEVLLLPKGDAIEALEDKEIGLQLTGLSRVSDRGEDGEHSRIGQWRLLRASLGDRLTEL